MKLRTINEDTPVEYLAESMTKLNALLAEGKLRGFSRPFTAKGLVVFDRTGKLVAEVSTYEVAKQVAKALNDFITEDKNLLEGRFVKGPGGVPLDRRGNPKTPKQSAVAKQAATPSPAAKQTLTLDMVWRKVEDVVGQIFPDGDPHDWLIPWFKQYGITGYKIGDMLDQAAKKNGYKDVYDYYESMKDLYESDLPRVGAKVATRLDELKTSTMVNYVNRASQSLGSLDPEKAKSRMTSVVKTANKISNRPDADEEIAKSAYERAKNLGRRFPAGEAAIAKVARYAYMYARYILKTRFPAGEAAIAKSAEFSFFYANKILNQRFPAGEAAIAKDPAYKDRYEALFGTKNKA